LKAPEVRVLPSPPAAERYLAVDKPEGRAVHGPGGLLAELRAAYGSGLTLVHRLDKETSGVLLLAKDTEALRAAHAAWAESVTKVYVARTRGVPSPREGTVDAPLLEHRTSRPDLLRRALTAAYGRARAGHLLLGRTVRAIPAIPPPGRSAAHPAGRPARTRYRVLSDEGPTALVELVPEQGRMHQLRVHLLSLGTPLLFDPLYDPGRRAGDPAPSLRAVRLEWRNPEGAPAGAVWRWEAAGP